MQGVGVWKRSVRPTATGRRLADGTAALLAQRGAPCPAPPGAKWAGIFYTSLSRALNYGALLHLRALFLYRRWYHSTTKIAFISKALLLYTGAQRTAPERRDKQQGNRLKPAPEQGRKGVQGALQSTRARECTASGGGQGRPLMGRGEACCKSLSARHAPSPG